MVRSGFTGYTVAETLCKRLQKKISTFGFIAETHRAGIFIGMVDDFQTKKVTIGRSGARNQ